jgi:hypothetical protein
LDAPTDCKQWITLFDADGGDDEYDGILGGEDDLEEEPRVLLRFHLTEHHEAVAMEQSRNSQAVIAALMNPLDDSSSSDEDVPVAVAATPPPVDMGGENEWDILKALRKRGQYPSWDLEWLQKLLSDKIYHLSSLVAEMQRNNNQVEKSVLARLASLQDFSRYLKDYLAQSESQQVKIRGDNDQHK